ncbi:hypothetical protein L207DRAFT_5418 [Hyaloscypha variabilis F]|uniref:Uncharacterized protein n=1 Tax=Hyaloscypha variabilis (strain UAMH 11265 / GT02V1 / F) TaxID=1149755 RepID=A0A2J6SC50_HYAVF|nr:hypothetical protein L207DRAFT_5418 [Hyaloscypha variabilis F]
MRRRSRPSSPHQLASCSASFFVVHRSSFCPYIIHPRLRRYIFFAFVPTAVFFHLRNRSGIGKSLFSAITPQHD